MNSDTTIYTYQEAFSQSLLYFGGDDLAARVWVDKYALKDGEGNILENSPVQMHRRLAKELARIEAKYANPLTEERIFSLLDHFRYIIPAGSPMMGIGNDYQLASLSNCFVIGQEGNADSFGAIMKLDEELVQIMKRRGGVGLDLSQLRPSGTAINSSSLTSMGVVPRMRRFNNSAQEIIQKNRHGALLLSIHAKHPDMAEFVDAKENYDNIHNARLSVRLDDAFMHAVETGDTYQQQFPVDATHPAVTCEVNAVDIWNKIIHNTWHSTEPSVLFWDTVLKESVADCYADQGFRTVSTNPCGEIPLCAYDSCRLMAINLFSYVVNPFTPDSRFNFELFRQHVIIAQRLMDDIVDLEEEKIQQILSKIETDPQDSSIKSTEYNLWKKILEKCQKGRRTGLGITAEGDMLAAMGLRYASADAIGFATSVQRTLALAAYRSSVTLAKERGAFSLFNAQQEQNHPFILRIKEAEPALYNEMIQYGRRNISLLTIAPTGSVSILTETSSGMEPAFKATYRRRNKIQVTSPDIQVEYVDDNGDSYEYSTVYHPNFKLWMKLSGYDLDKRYTLEELSEMVSKSPYANSTADTVDAISKVKMQGALQKWVDHSISLTINVPEDTSEETISTIYLEAWKNGCKGCTIYRQGSRQVLPHAVPEKKHTSVTEVRPQVLECDVVRFQNNKDKWVAFVGLLDGYPYEIFTGIQDDEEGILLPKSVMKGRIIRNSNRDGSHRYDFQFENKRGYKTTVEGLSEKFNKEYWNYAKLISGVLRYRMPLDRVVKLVSSLQLDDDNINTWKNGVTKALKKYVKDGSKVGGVCPVCGHETLVYQEGCTMCQHCGASQCG